MSIYSELYSSFGCPILLTSAESVFYVSGFSGEGLLFITENMAYVITDSRYEIYVKECCGKYCNCVISNDYYEALGNIIYSNYYRTIAIENNEISYGDYCRIQDFNISIIHLNTFIPNKRMIKNDIELCNISIASKISDLVFHKVLSNIYLGISEKELSAYIDYQIKLLGGDGNAFETIVAFNENTAKPHAIPGHNKLINNSVVLIDFGSTYNHYCSDMTRTFVYGKASDSFVKVYNIVKDANYKAIESIGPDVTCFDVDAAARNCIKEAGFGEYFVHSTGHGVGLKCHELPTISNRNKSILQCGTVFTIEPGIYIESEFGVRIEDLIFWGNNEKIIITESSKDLIQL